MKLLARKMEFLMSHSFYNNPFAHLFIKSSLQLLLVQGEGQKLFKQGIQMKNFSF